MNKAQKKIVASWYKIGFLILVISLVALAPFENKQIAMIIIAGPVFTWLTFDKNINSCQGYGAAGDSLGEFVSRHGKLKFWLVLYCSFILPILVFHMYTHQGTPWLLYILSLLLLVAPLFIVSELERYIEAGKNA